jgi:hypothetical protein
VVIKSVAVGTPISAKLHDVSPEPSTDLVVFPIVKFRAVSHTLDLPDVKLFQVVGDI